MISLIKIGGSYLSYMEVPLILGIAYAQSDISLNLPMLRKSTFRIKVVSICSHMMFFYKTVTGDVFGLIVHQINKNADKHFETMRFCGVPYVSSDLNQPLVFKTMRKKGEINCAVCNISSNYSSGLVKNVVKMSWTNKEGMGYC